MVRYAELGNLPAVAGSTVIAHFGADAFCSLLVENALSAPVFVNWSGAVPGLGAYDAVCPGSAVRTIPVPPGVNTVTFAVAYPGAVPAADAGLHCLVAATSVNLGATSGPLA